MSSGGQFVMSPDTMKSRIAPEKRCADKGLASYGAIPLSCSPTAAFRRPRPWYPGTRSLTPRAFPESRWLPGGFPPNFRQEPGSFNSLKEIGAPGEIRTPGLCLRRAALYPAELRVRWSMCAERRTGRVRIAQVAKRCKRGDGDREVGRWWASGLRIAPGARWGVPGVWGAPTPATLQG